MSQIFCSVITAVTLTLVGCDPPSRPPSPVLPSTKPQSASPVLPATTSPPSATASAVPPPPEKLNASQPYMHLPVAELPAAVVSLPLGATGPRPVVIATHGNYDRPEWQCEVWREIIGNEAFILCPRGVARPDSPSPDDIRFTYQTNQHLEKEVLAGLQALQQQYPKYVDPEGVIYTGFSLGAIMGVSIASRNPAMFSRLVLVEGGHDKWTPAIAKAFGEGGGKRVLFVCAQGGCPSAARLAASRLAKVGVEGKVVQSKEAGHRYDGPVAVETQKALPWVLEGDTRWGAATP